MRVLIASHLASGHVGVDIGANKGRVVEYMCSASSARHLAFEPIPHLAEAIREHYPGVDVRNVALADAPAAVAEFEYYPDRHGFSGFPGITHPPSGTVAETLHVPVSTLDSEIGDVIPRVVKIDVEGAELPVLRGARRTLERHRPLVIFEHGKGPSDAAAIHDLLTAVGLAVFDIDGFGPFTRSEWLERKKIGGVWNWIAC